MVILGSSVYGGTLSLDPDRVFLDEEIVSNTIIFGIVDCSVFVWRSESYWK